MTNLVNDESNCGCGPDCCQPKKKNKWWMTLIIVVVLVAAGTIIAVKLVGGSEPETLPTSDTITNAQPQGCDTSCVKTCTKITNPGQNPPCCPQAKQ